MPKPSVTQFLKDAEGNVKPIRLVARKGIVKPGDATKAGYVPPATPPEPAAADPAA